MGTPRRVACVTLVILAIITVPGIVPARLAAGQAPQQPPPAPVPQPRQVTGQIVPEFATIPDPSTKGPTPRFSPSVTLVKLDSCDPAVMAKAMAARVGGAESGEQNRARAAVEQYHALLAAYAEGDGARGIDAVLGMKRSVLERTLQSLNKRDADPQAPWDARRYAQAVMLHTDAGLRLAGDRYGADAYAQLQVAADILQLGVTCGPEEFRALAPRWYVALSRVLRDRGGPDAMRTAEALLTLGRRRLDSAALVFFDSGHLAESFATVFALSRTDPLASWTGGDSQIVKRTVERRRQWLGDAATWLARAATLDPGNDDVLVHLGRVRALQFDDAAALSTLRTVLERTPSKDLAYVAASFMAAVHDRQGQLEDAAAAYRTAIARVPSGHAARVGLADVLRRSGQVDEARTLLHTLTAGRTKATNDPLWWYAFEPPGAADERLEALRTEMRR